MAGETSTLIEQASAVHLQTADDDPRQARIELLALVEKFNRLLNALGNGAFKNSGNAEGNLVTLSAGGILPQGILPAIGTKIPTATVLDFFAASAPTGWLEASGQEIKSENGSEFFNLYKHLFDIATAETNPIEIFETSQTLEAARNYASAQNAWDDSFPIPIPDLRGRTRIARGNPQDIELKEVGEKVGEENTALEKRHLPNVTLAIHKPTSTDTGENDRFILSAQKYSRDVTSLGGSIVNKTEAMGEGAKHNNMQPSFVVLTCIKL